MLSRRVVVVFIFVPNSFTVLFFGNDYVCTRRRDGGERKSFGKIVSAVLAHIYARYTHTHARTRTYRHTAHAHGNSHTHRTNLERWASVSVELAALNVPNSFNINYYSSFENVVYNTRACVCVCVWARVLPVGVVFPEKTARATFAPSAVALVFLRCL